jgi:hypothetical protein
MARETGTRASARRRRTKHEQRIDERTNPLERLSQTWSWLYAEARRAPHLLDDTLGRVHQIAAELNNHEANPREGEDQ